MRRIFVLVCCLVTFFAFTFKTESYNLIDFSDGQTYVILNEVPKTEDIIEVKNKQEFKKYKEEYKGVTQRTSGDLTKAYLFLNKLSAEIVEINNENGFTEILAFSEKLKESTEIDKNKVNIQIVIKDNELVIGIPVIFDCY